MIEPNAAAPDRKEDSLFTRLPSQLFAPLASQTREHYWRLLLRLYDNYFGPEADQPEDGFDHRSLTLEIERFLISNKEWVGDDGEPLGSPINVRANLVLARLRSSGWIREDRVGVRSYAVMSPAVVAFLGLLKQFAEEGPQIVGGQVQVIHNTLLQVKANPGDQGAAFSQAAADTVRLVSTLNATSVRVREVMGRLTKGGIRAESVRAFFREYISELYLRDYADLRTLNHPLRHRNEILDLVSQISSDETSKAKLKAWYGAMFHLRSDSECEERFQRDVERLSRFHDIQKYLDRLDDAVGRATQQAVSAITYSLRVQGRVDELVERAAAMAIADETAGVGYAALPLSPGQLFSEGQLREPRGDKPLSKRSATRKVVLTDRQRALMMLRAAREQERSITPKQVEAYVGSFLREGVATSDDLRIKTIGDLCVFLALSREANARAFGTGRRGAGSQAVRAVKGLALTPVKGEWTENQFVRAGRFRLERKERG